MLPSLEQDSSFWLWCFVLLLTAYYIGSNIASYRRLCHFKGPPFAAWSFLWYLRASNSGEGHLRLAEVNDKYGPLARIGPNMLLSSDGELYRKMSARGSGYTRDSFYKAYRFGADKENVFSELDKEKHQKLRKQLSPGYSGKDNMYLEPDIDVVIWSLIKSWKERYISNGSTLKPMDIAIQFQLLTLDIITSLSFGQPLGYVTTDSDLYEYIKTTGETLPAMNLCAAIPVVNQLLAVTWIQKLISPSMKDRIGLGKIKAVSNEIIARRFAQSKAQKDAKIKSDMTGSFIARGMTLAEITDNSLLNILAGSETTSVVLRTAFASILTQPKILRILHAEIDAANIPMDQIITHARSQELPYLQACIKEALRCHPAPVGILPRVVPPQGDHYKGQFIPGGTLIGQCGWKIHYLNYEAYGPDAKLYRPERWIEASEAARAGKPDRLERMERAHELIFASGDFKCLGYQISLIELGKIMFEIFRRFEFGFIDGFRTIEKDISYGLFVQEGMWVRVEERSGLKKVYKFRSARPALGFIQSGS